MFTKLVQRKLRTVLIIAVVLTVILASASLTAALAQGPGGDGNPPGGTPPGGAPPADGAGAPGDSTGTNPVLVAGCGVYTLDGEVGESTTGQSYSSTGADESDICVINGGTLSLTDPTITKSGDTSSADSSSTITATLQNGSSLVGSINADNTA